MTAFSDETGRGWLPLKYEDGPDFCTVTLATGAAFALTVHPERMKLMEAALSASPVAPTVAAASSTCKKCGGSGYAVIVEDYCDYTTVKCPDCEAPPAAPAGVGADEKCATYRNALLWAFDRLTVTGGMNADEQRRTMREIGSVLTGKTSPAATYQPNDWDDSTALLSRGSGSDQAKSHKDGSR